jgi:hypothetical protein
MGEVMRGVASRPRAPMGDSSRASQLLLGEGGSGSGWLLQASASGGEGAALPLPLLMRSPAAAAASASASASAVCISITTCRNRPRISSTVDWGATSRGAIWALSMTLMRANEATNTAASASSEALAPSGRGRCSRTNCRTPGVSA